MQSIMPTTNYKFNDFTGQTFYVGLDVHKKSWAVTVHTLGLEVAHFSQVADPGQLSHYLNNRYRGGNFLSAYEAGFCGITLHQLLCIAGPQSYREPQRKNLPLCGPYLTLRILWPTFLK